MPYSETFKRKMIQKLTGPNAISANALSKKVDVSQTTLSKWLKNAGITTHFKYPYQKTIIKRYKPCPLNDPKTGPPEAKLKAVLEAASLSEEQLGAFLRKQGIHETHLQQWRLQMLNGLGKTVTQKKTNKRSNKDAKRIRSLEKELNRKEKALAEAAALLVLKKKVQEIWGEEDNATSPKNGK